MPGLPPDRTVTAEVPAKAGRPKNQRVGLWVVGVLVAFGLIVFGATGGWLYLKFRAIPKISVPKTALGSAPDLAAPVVEWNPEGESATVSGSGTAAGVSAAQPGSASENSSGVANPGALIATSVPSASPVVASTVVAPGATPVAPVPPVATVASGLPTLNSLAGGVQPDGVTALPVEPGPAAVTDPPISAEGDVAAAQAEANCLDEAQVVGATVSCAAANVTFSTAPPGPLVDVRGLTSLGGKGTKNYLMVGADSRSEVPKGQDVAFGVGKVTGTRTDTIFVLRIDPNAHQAWILSIPRDLWLPLATSGQPTRINAAYAKSPGELVRTISTRLNIPIDHLVEINFTGFQKIVATVGGVQICFTNPTRDVVSGLNRPNPGCQILDGPAATAYVRSRHYEQFANGAWVTDPSSDLGRIRRQQQFIRSVMRRALDQSSNPLTLNAMLDNLKSAIKIDKTFTFPETTTLANDLRSFDPNALQAYTLPVTAVRVNGAAVLKLNSSAAAAIVGKFRGN